MRFTESHEWVKLEGNIATIGITDYAQKELGEIVYIELPKMGQVVKAGEEISILESTKAAADIYAPLSGKIIEVNDSLKKNPSSINQCAEHASWLFRLEITHRKELDHLLTKEQYQAMIG